MRSSSHRLRRKSSSRRRPVLRLETLEARQLLATFTQEDQVLSINVSDIPAAPAGAVVADYTNDFTGPTPAPGWSYLWNSAGNVSNSANYTPLLSTGSTYDSNGVAGLPDPTPLSYGHFHSTGGHAGRGYAQDAVSRYLLAAFAPATAGNYALTNTVYNDSQPSCGNGNDLRVLVDNQIVRTGGFNANTNSPGFDTPYFRLDAGQNVYVAIGPNFLDDGCDGFALDFTVRRLSTFTSVAATSAKGAQLSLTADGTIAYNPRTSATLQALAAGATDTDTFSVSYNDPSGTPLTATMTVTVRGVGDALTAIDDAPSAGENGATTLPVTSNDTAPAYVIADYRDDYSGTARPGWRYLFNGDGPFGNPANYVPLVYNGANYDFNGINGLPDSNPASYTYLTPTGGHPGQGSGDGGSLGIDRGPIAAFTVPYSGSYRLTNAFVQGSGGGGNGGRALVHVNNSMRLDLVFPSGPSNSLNTDLGALSAGDTIYVAISPNGTNGSDSFLLDYSVEFTPSTSVSSIGTSALGVTPTVAAGGVSYDPSALAAVQALAQGQTLSDSFTYTLIGSDSNADSATANVTIVGANDAPTASAGGPFSVAEGAGVTLIATASDIDDGATLTYEWDLNNDGTFELTGLATPTLARTWTQLQSAGINDGPGSYTFRVRARDEFGAVSADALGTIDVSNTPAEPEITTPALPSGGFFRTVPGLEQEYFFSASEPSSADAAAIVYRIDWEGDGVVDVTQTGPASGIALLHAYDALGDYELTVTADDGETALLLPAVQAVRVGNVAVDENGDLQVSGTDGSDRIIISQSAGIQIRMNNRLLGSFDFPGSLIVHGNAGNDTITVSGRAFVSVILHGGEGSDYLTGGGEADQLFGDEGNDRLLGGGGGDELDGGEGNDTLSGGLGADTAFGGAGNDRLNGDSGDDTLDGGDDRDTLSGGGGSDTLFGGTALDRLDGGAGHDVMVGGEGGDKLYGRDGNDVVIGSAGFDALYGGNGLDLLVGDSTAFDEDALSLGQLLADWASGQDDSGLTDGDLIDDGVDTLYGEGSSDLFVLFFGERGMRDKRSTDDVRTV